MPLLTRRSLLRLLALAPLLRAAAPATIAGGAGLPVAYRRLAAVGKRLVRSDPADAESLYRFAMGEVSRSGRRLPGDASGADTVCAVLLAHPRVAAELRGGLVHRVDGWLLSRSEAGACVYLYRLARS